MKKQKFVDIDALFHNLKSREFQIYMVEYNGKIDNVFVTHWPIPPHIIYRNYDYIYKNSIKGFDPVLDTFIANIDVNKIQDKFNFSFPWGLFKPFDYLDEEWFCPSCALPRFTMLNLYFHQLYTFVDEFFTDEFRKNYDASAEPKMNWCFIFEYLFNFEEEQEKSEENIVREWIKSGKIENVQQKLKPAAVGLDTPLQSFDVNFLIQKKSFLNSFSENFQFYSFKFIRYMIYDSTYKDDVDLFDRVYLAAGIAPGQLNLFLAIMFDKLYFLTLLNIPFFTYFMKSTQSFSEINSLLLNNPEYYLIFKSIIFDYFFENLTNLYPSLALFNIEESYLSSISYGLQFLTLFIVVFIFLILYFIYFNFPFREDNITDHDFLAVNVTIESEEEIGAIDDMLLASVILVFLFFWFFWVESWIYLSNYTNFMIIIFLFPLLYYIIFFIPTNLLFDYGSYFLPYLNGVGKSAVILMELLFDYIAISIFFLRLIVQNVRLIFMIFTYSELHELVIFYTTNPSMIIGNESIISGWQTLKNLINSKSFSYFFDFLTRFIKWLYELFHTFFMIIFQFIAFFAMVFWLFLFLYTMFVIEKQEAYFFDLKLNRLEYYKKIYNYKNHLNILINENMNYLFNSFSLNSKIYFYSNKKFKKN